MRRYISVVVITVLSCYRYEQAALVEPMDYQPLWRSGNLHLKRREFAQAKSSYYRALQLNPSSVQVLYSLGKLFSEQGLYRNAVEVLEKVVVAAPRSRVSLSLLAKAYRETGNLEKAGELERRTSQDLTLPTSEQRVLSARQHVSQRNFKVAEGYYKEALASFNSTGRAELLLEMGSFFVQRNKCSEAVDHLLSALELLEKGLKEGRAVSESEREMRERVRAELQHCHQWREGNNDTVKNVDNFSTGRENVQTLQSSQNAEYVAAQEYY